MLDQFHILGWRPRPQLRATTEAKEGHGSADDEEEPETAEEHGSADDEEVPVQEPAEGAEGDSCRRGGRCHDHRCGVLARCAAAEDHVVASASAPFSAGAFAVLVVAVVA
jgi:hypothetical protein